MLDAGTLADKAVSSPVSKLPAIGTLSVKRYFTKDKPSTNAFDLVDWETRDVEIKDKDGKIVFAQKDVEVPKFWSVTATTIVASKYFRGHGAERETSVRQLIDRVVKTLAQGAVQHRYLTEDEALIMEDELRYLCLFQMMAYNSPVWFNVGAEKDPQCSACFILEVKDNMDSILNWYKEEGKVFQKGSGAGLNISHIRERNSQLSGGGHASGPLSFAMAADESAGTIKSGGKTRRAAKMLVMDVDHPDIEEFLETKMFGERVAQALIAAGFSSDFTDEKGAYALAPWQNANNSVRVTDAFMEAVEKNTTFGLKSRVKSGGVARMVNAKDLFRSLCEATWGCGDPGVQFHDTVNDWHTCPEDGEIEASNPCSEYMFLNNTACNLASFNLMRFRGDDGTFKVEDFVAAATITYLSMDVIVSMSGYPTDAISREAKKYRTLGAGFANLGALLMADGIAYDSDEGRDYAAAIMSLLSAVGYQTSGRMAEKLGAFEGFFKNQKHVVKVIAKHQKAHGELAVRSREGLAPLLNAATDVWSEAKKYAESTGVRNAQVTVLAPTGTISFMMDCDTTGIEPDLGLVKYKKLVGGGSLKIANQTVKSALKKLNYDENQIKDIVAFIEKNDTIEGSTLRSSHLPVFDCSLVPAKGERSITPAGHVDMMVACQPFISGAISKTVNMPREATVEDIERVYTTAWKNGLKAIAIYRDGCKESQPLNMKADVKSEVTTESIKTIPGAKPFRERLPNDRMAAVHKFSIAGHDGYMTLGYYPDGRLGEVFVNIAKQGSTLNALLDAWATMISLGLQYGIPLNTLTEKFRHTNFEPSGFTGNPEIRSCSSILDYIVQMMELRSQVEVSGGLQTVPQAKDEDAPTSSKKQPLVSGPPCSNCGDMTVRAGACYKCNNCGNTTGCG